MLYLPGEQEVEPVRVAELGSLEVGIAGCLGVLQSEASLDGVVGTELLEHVAIDAGVLGVDHVVELKPAFVVHFLIDAHHLLRVHDVVVVVAGFEAGCELARVVHAGVSLRASLGGDDDHAAHGPGTVDGGGRAVLQDGERLDIVGVQACHGRGYQGLGVAGSQVVGTDIDIILVDDAIHYPQGLGVTVDGGCAAHTDFGRGTESARHIRHLHTGHAPFQ